MQISPLFLLEMFLNLVQSILKFHAFVKSKVEILAVITDNFIVSTLNNCLTATCFTDFIWGTDQWEYNGSVHWRKQLIFTINLYFQCMSWLFSHLVNETKKTRTGDWVFHCSHSSPSPLADAPPVSGFFSQPVPSVRPKIAFADSKPFYKKEVR